MAVAGFDDKELWVVGDLPSAYFVVDDVPTPRAALETYCSLMEDWAEQVLSGDQSYESFPVAAEPTEEHARMLLSRVEHLREVFAPLA